MNNKRKMKKKKRTIEPPAHFIQVSLKKQKGWGLGVAKFMPFLLQRMAKDGD
jgi:hypothetical protein